MKIVKEKNITGKKEIEIINLKRFISTYNEKINKNVKFEILDINKIKLIYPDYNGENPDFVLLINDKYVAVELFELVKDNIEPLNKNAVDELNNPKNSAHLYSQRVKRDDQTLYLMENLAEVALERINNKIQNKLKYYITCPLWLIGYADKTYNKFLLTPYNDDNIQKNVVDYISKNILRDKKIEKIWLAEFSSKNLLLEIK